MTVAAVALAAAATAVPVPAAATEDELIGIRLLEAPVDREDDPRARQYVIDHLRPGQTISRSVEVSNRSRERRTFDLYAGSAEVDGDEFRFGEGRDRNELAGWVTVDQPIVIIEPWETAEVEATIAVPAAASEGERYAVLWAQSAVAPTEWDNVGAVRRVGIRLYIDVGAGGEAPSGFDIGEITAARGPDGAPTVSAEVLNTGGRALDIGGLVTLTDGPGSMRAGPYHVTTPTTLAPDAVGQVTARLDPELPLGPWRLELTLTSGTVKRTASATLTLPAAGVSRAEPVGWPGLAVPATGASIALAAGLALVVARRRKRRTARHLRR